MAGNGAVILAGGQGKRMKSSRPKVLCEVLFRPMIDWVLAAVEEACIPDACVVTGHLAEQVQAHVTDRCETVLQSERLGTGHAVMQARDFISRYAGGHVLVLNGDAPLMDAETIRGALRAHISERNAVTVISAHVEQPFGYGRIVRDQDGSLARIVEEKDADEAVRAICEVNSGAFWFTAEDLLFALDRLTNDNAQQEYYLTDTVAILLAQGKRAGAFAAQNAQVVLGANDRVQLLELNDLARQAILERVMREGADIPCTDGVLIGPDVTVGRDTLILPGTILTGTTVIGSDCTIGPDTQVADSVIGNGVLLDHVKCTRAAVEDGATIGPYVQLRPDTVIHTDVHIGDFVEIKNSEIGAGTKVPHLTYVGDSDVGSGVNFGCGCVTVNYDGKNKARTTVGDHAFIGCNTNLIAPVCVGDYAFTAAGSTITQDVPADALAIARARQENKAGWVQKKKPYKGMD